MKTGIAIGCGHSAMMYELQVGLDVVLQELDVARARGRMAGVFPARPLNNNEGGWTALAVDPGHVAAVLALNDGEDVDE